LDTFGFDPGLEARTAEFGEALVQEAIEALAVVAGLGRQFPRHLVWMRRHVALEILLAGGGCRAENELASVEEADVILDLLDRKFEAK